MADYEALLLQEDSSEFPIDNDESNDSLEQTEGVKTRAGTQPVMEFTDKGTTRIVKGSATTTKSNKRKASKSVFVDKPAKVAKKKQSFSITEITELKEKLGMKQMFDCLTLLNSTVQNLVTAQSKANLGNVSVNHLPSQSNSRQVSHTATSSTPSNGNKCKLTITLGSLDPLVKLYH